MRFRSVLAFALFVPLSTLFVGGRAQADPVTTSGAPKYKTVAVLTSGTNGCVNVITGVSGKVLRVWAAVLSNNNSSGNSNFEFKSITADARLIGGFKLGSGGTVFTMGPGPVPLFETPSGDGIKACAFTASDIEGHLVYTVADPVASPEPSCASTCNPNTVSSQTVAFATAQPVTCDGCSGGGGGAECSESEPCSVAIANAGDELRSWGSQAQLGWGLVAFVGAALLIIKYVN